MTRADWPEVRDRLDGAAVIASYLGAPPRHKGGKPLWCCPFHDDSNPSMEWDRDKGRFKCWACGEGGDVADFVMKRLGLTFPEAVAALAGDAPPPRRRAVPRAVEAMRRPRPADRQVPPAPATPKKPRLDHDGALALVAEAEARLWSDAGVQALRYLHGRGLSDDTIRAARLGHVVEPDSVPWRPVGITIPWFEWGRCVYLNVRASGRWMRQFEDRPKDKRPAKYLCAFRDGAVLYPSLASVRPFLPLVVVEGEFDALLLGQELAGLASVVTCGAASEAPGPNTLMLLSAATRWFTAMDDDRAGNIAAEGDRERNRASVWKAGATRVKPPEGKDWTAAFQAGVDLKAFWEPLLREV